jgi:hypothetical protein
MALSPLRESHARCIHAGANASALRVPVQGVTGAGGGQRKSPTRGSKGNTFVDMQPTFAYPGYCAGFRRSRRALCQRDGGRCWNDDEKQGFEQAFGREDRHMGLPGRKITLAGVWHELSSLADQEGEAVRGGVSNLDQQSLRVKPRIKTRDQYFFSVDFRAPESSHLSEVLILSAAVEQAA